MSVGDRSDCGETAELFRHNFTIKSLLEVQSAPGLEPGARTVGNSRTTCIIAKDIKKIINNVQRGKSPGYDGFNIELFKYAGVHLPRVLSMFLNQRIGITFLKHS